MYSPHATVPCRAKLTVALMMTMIMMMIMMMMMIRSAVARTSRVVRTESGPVRGYLDLRFDIFAFYGIPYATAPTGPHKFKAPLPAPVWLDTLDAVDKGVICPQNLTYEGKYQKEDCLIANVYVPNTYATSLPVMVHCHGGGYQRGYGTKRTPKHLVRSKRIIVVNFNYRLGTHGFLCLGTRDVPGNAGMKDHVALLRWVQRNIARFGGNPADVTINGFSSGGSAVSLLTLSKMARGLFSKVVADSGVAVGVWSMQLNPLTTAQRHAFRLGFNNTKDIYALEQFYKKIDFRHLNVDYSKNSDHTFDGFAPCVERKIDAGGRRETFLDDAPVNIMKSGDYVRLPSLYSFVADELHSDTTNGFVLPADLQFKNRKEKMNVLKEVTKFYSKNGVRNFYEGDVTYTYPLLRNVRLHVQAGHRQLYLYQYSYGNADHCCQTYAIMDDKDNERENSLSKEFKRVKAVLREILLNFVTTGRPVRQGAGMPSWEPVLSSEGGPHMAVGAALAPRGPPDQARRARFWDTIYDVHYRAPAPPPAPPTAVTLMRRLL